MKSVFVAVFVIFGAVSMVRADVASAGYVNEKAATKVDTTLGSSNTLAGSYTVSGKMVVSTPELPAE